MLPEVIKQEALRLLQNHYDEWIKITDSNLIEEKSYYQSFRLETNKEIFFLKFNEAGQYLGMFEKESSEFELIKSTNTFYVPEIIATGKAGEYAFIIMEFTEEGRRKNDFWVDFAKKLSRMHQYTDKNFSLDHDNYINSLQQYNNFHDNWYDFFILERLEPQLQIARNKGHLNKGHVHQFKNLYKQLINIIPEEKPTLVHGNLSNKTYMINCSGEPALFQPSTAYNHREVDIAMSKLFTTFDQNFYDNYNLMMPMESGWEERLPIYNLYPLLIYVNLYGMRYLSRLERIINDF